MAVFKGETRCATLYAYAAFLCCFSLYCSLDRQRQQVAISHRCGRASEFITVASYSLSAAMMMRIWKPLLQRQMSDSSKFMITLLAKNYFLNFIFVFFLLFILAQAKEQQQNILQRHKVRTKTVDLKILDTRRLLVTQNGICVIFVILSSASLRELKNRLNLVILNIVS